MVLIRYAVDFSGFLQTFTKSEAGNTNCSSPNDCGIYKLQIYMTDFMYK